MGIPQARRQRYAKHCLSMLGRYKTPKGFRFVAELPKGPSGKVQGLKLAENAG